MNGSTTERSHDIAVRETAVQQYPRIPGACPMNCRKKDRKESLTRKIAVHVMARKERYPCAASIKSATPCDPKRGIMEESSWVADDK
jgi:hypothetical protein